MNRYHDVTCGELNESHVGRTARLAGWVHRKRDLGGIVFIDLRDHYGMTQVVIDPSAGLDDVVAKLRSEFSISVEGAVVRRQEGMENPALATGDIELRATKLEILGEAEPLPMPVYGDEEISETVRLKFRFLDLRRDRIHRNIVLRSRVISSIRRRMTTAATATGCAARGG